MIENLFYQRPDVKYFALFFFKSCFFHSTPEFRDSKRLSARRYITMRVMSAFIFVRVTLSLHGNAVLSAVLFGKSVPHRHATIKATLM